MTLPIFEDKFFSYRGGGGGLVLAVCLGSLSCWKTKHLPKPSCRADCERFSSSISLYSVAFMESDAYQTSDISGRDATPHHDAAATMPDCADDVACLFLMPHLFSARWSWSYCDQNA